MKKLILTIAIVSLLTDIFAQDSKPCLFIGITTIKNSICSDTKYTEEAVADLEEYKLKKNAFREQNKANSYALPGGAFIDADQSVIIYETKSARSGFNCSPSTHGLIKGKTIEECMAKLKASDVKQPSIVFQWSGKGKARKG